MFKNIERGGIKMASEKKEVFKDIREMRIVAKDLLDDPKSLEEKVEEALKKSPSKWSSSQLKIDVLEAGSGKICSLAYFQKTEKHLSEFSEAVNDCVANWKKNNPRWKQSKEKVKEQKKDSMGYDKIKPFDPDKKYSWDSFSGHTSKD